MANEMTDPSKGGQLARGRATRAVAAGVEANADMALLEFQSPSIALISKPVPIFSFYATWVIASMVAILLVIAGTIPIDRVVTATGRVVSGVPNLLVQPLDISVVRSIDVRVGQRVRKGDLLARLDPTFTGADQASLEALNANLQAEVDRLTAESAGTLYYNNATSSTQLQTAIAAQRRSERSYTVESYNQKVAALQTTLAGDLTQVRNYTDRFGYAETLLRAREELERQGVGSKLNTLQARDTFAEARRMLDGAKSSSSADQRNVNEMMAERDSYVQQKLHETSQDLSDATRKLDDAREQLNKARRHREMVDLRAGQDATVLAISSVSVGSVMNIGDPFITLVPDSAVMEVDAVLEATEVSFVRPGDLVIIKFDAYRLFEHGFAEGHVLALGPDAQTLPGNQSSSSSTSGVGIGMGAPNGGALSNALALNSNTVYRVRTSIDMDNLKKTMTNLPPDFRLQPGLGVQADIKVGHRTMLSYLFGRYLPTLTEGMREP